jgi:putative ABC transport system ATP-binding protein
MVVIDIHNVHFRWNNTAKDVLVVPKLKIAAGEQVLLRGDSGTGKSTLFGLICGVHVATKGVVSVLNENLSTLGQKRRDRFRARHLGIIFQQFNLLPYLSVLDNVIVGAKFSGTAMPNLHERALDLLETLGVAELIKRPASQLSIGQQQRVAAARTLIGNPEIIIADEPTSALDPRNRARFMELLFDALAQRNTTLLFAGHDANAADFSRTLDLRELNHAA